MSKTQRRGREPYVRPVKKIEVSEKNIPLRIALTVGFLAIGIGLLAYAVSSALSVDPSWQVVEVNSSKVNCSQDLILNYDFSGTGTTATSLSKRLTGLYSKATEDACVIFSADIESDEIRNLRYLNQHVNEEVEVDPALYEALALVQKYQNRCVYLAPVYIEYDRIFLYENEEEAAIYDPGQNSELMPYIQELAAYANDPEMIDLELLGENRVRLNVAQDYLDYVQANEIEGYLDFHWMTNAFITDYIAGILVENGFTSGYLVSYDGFTRNLDQRELSYSFNLFDSRADGTYLPGRMDYTGPASIVFLRSFPMTQQDRWHYFPFSSGRIVTAQIDPTDGVSKSAIDNLVSYSTTAGCAELLMQMLPVYLTDEFSAEGLGDLTEKGTYSVWCLDDVIHYNQEGLSLTVSEETHGVRYSKTYVSPDRG